MPLKEDQAKGKEEASLSGAVEALTISHEIAEGGSDTDTSGQKGGAKDDDDKDADLFKPPPKFECPLCFVVLPVVPSEIGYAPCCGNRICLGCYWKHGQVLATSNAKRALKDPPEPPLEDNCAFCRAPIVLKSNEEALERVKARMALNDPNAFDLLGSWYHKGLYGLPRDSRKEFELRLRGAELGSASACYNLACAYGEGIVVELDLVKQEHYAKLAAKKGHIVARHNLGCVEARRGNDKVAVRHWMISASAGHDDSLVNIRIAHQRKYATKDQYEKAIRANKKAKEEMESEERDKARAARAAGVL